MGGIHRWLLGVFCTARSDVPEREGEGGGGVRAERDKVEAKEEKEVGEQ